MTLGTYPLVYLPVAAALRRADPAMEDTAHSLGVGPVAHLLAGHPAAHPHRRARRLRAGRADGDLRIRRVRDPALPDLHHRDLHRVPVRLPGGRRPVDPARAASACSCWPSTASCPGGASPGAPRRVGRAPSGCARPRSRRWLASVRSCRPRRSACRSARSSTGWPRASTPRCRPRRRSARRPGRRSATAPGRRCRRGAGVAGRHDEPSGARAAPGSSLERSTYVTQALPGVVIALSLVFFATHYAFGIYQTSVLLIAAYAILHFPLALVCVKTSVRPGPGPSGRRRPVTRARARRGVPAGHAARCSLPGCSPGSAWCSSRR